MTKPIQRDQAMRQKPESDAKKESPTKRPSPWLLLPHGVSLAGFLLSDAWRAFVGNNRSAPDLYLAVAGYLALVVASIASLYAFIAILRAERLRRDWRWILLHVAALFLALFLGLRWLGNHLV